MWQDMNPGFGVMIWGEPEIKELLRTFYPEYLGAWNELNNVGKKVDFARCIVMHRYGGFYFDNDVEPLKSLEVFLAQKYIYCKNLRNCFNPEMHFTKDPVDLSPVQLIIGADNFSARPSREHEHILTNCFIASTPQKDFWREFIDHQIPRLTETVLTSFGTWALTDFVRKYQPANFLELPSYYFNWMPKDMQCEPQSFTYAIHHSKMKWVDPGGDWFSQK